jgi:hypothetical protein
MAKFYREVEIPLVNQELLIGLNPSGEFDRELLPYLKTSIQSPESRHTHFLPLYLEAPLKIKFSVSTNGGIERDFKPCRCKVQIKSEEYFKSLNSAYTQMSIIFEKQRISHGGAVHDNIYSEREDGIWEQLKHIREQVYAPYREEYERLSRMVKSQKEDLILLSNQEEDFIPILLREKEAQVRALMSQEVTNLESRIKELSDLLKATRISFYKEKVEQFKERLKLDIPETAGKDSWQEWIFDNKWMFGIHYGDPIQKERISFKSIPDFLLPTADGFLDILEIKKPNHKVIERSKSHTEAYIWAKEVNEAIGQVVAYLRNMDAFGLHIKDSIKKEYGQELSAIKPRAIILIGTSDDWDVSYTEAFRAMNSALHAVEVITYTELLRRAEKIVEMYTY